LEDLELNRLFGGSFAGCRVLVTGHTGFKGSWLALWLKALGAEVGGLALDPDTDPSHWNLLGLRLARDTRVDLRNAKDVCAELRTFAPEVVFHLAAQPLVRRSYKDPVATFDVNVGGLVHLLEAVRNCPSVKVVINATTDKVYEPRETLTGYREDDPLGGHDPYSTSKACAELVSACYRQSYFELGGTDSRRVQLATARAGNVIGGGDWGEDRLVPDLVRAAQSAHPLRLRNPRATRPWQHVLEPLSGYLRIAQLLLSGRVAAGAWNLGPSADATLAVGDVVERLQCSWSGLRVEEVIEPQPHEAMKLTLDCRKAERELGWQPVWDAATTIERTARWYRSFGEDGSIRSRDDLVAYVSCARQSSAGWAE
jgi:CDP-glucose 4,6-dehydratase